MITGDKRMTTPGTFAYERFMLQKAQVDALDVALWPQGGLFKPFFMRGHYDMVTSQDPFWRGLVAQLLAIRFGARLNVQVHADLAEQSFIKHVLSQITLRHADSVRVVSEKIKKQVERVGGKAQISVLPIYVDIEKFRSAARKPHEQKTIFWIGRFEEEKDPLLAIEVFKKVRKEGVDAKLIMLGGGSMKETLVRESAGLPVEYPGWQQEILPYLEVSDVVLCTSPQESWGASIVEALAAGLPVVAPDVGIAKEAGAIIADRKELSQKVIEVLRLETKGHLQILLPTAEEWALQWKNTL